jgi:cytoskeletal protein RodZ
MLHPVGSLPPRVYWRRRVVVLAVLLAVVFLFGLTVRTLGSSSDGAEAGPSTSVVSHTTVPPPTTSTAATPPSATSTTAAPPSSSAAVVPCAIAQLKIAAATDKPTYKIGDQPVVVMQVTNPGPLPCTQALGDAQIEFRIYNGAARVWGSHDCKIDPTPDVETLPVNATVAKTVTWSGYSSETTCGVRQRVGAGTYTLSTYLAGTVGATAQFAITG